MLVDLFDDIESSQSTRQIVCVNFGVTPRRVANRSLLRPVREEGKVAVGHVAVLGAEQKSKRD